MRRFQSHLSDLFMAGNHGLDVMTLAKISGHADLRILQAVYYSPDMSKVAERIS